MVLFQEFTKFIGSDIDSLLVDWNMGIFVWKIAYLIEIILSLNPEFGIPVGYVESNLTILVDLMSSGVSN